MLFITTKLRFTLLLQTLTVIFSRFRFSQGFYMSNEQVEVAYYDNVSGESITTTDPSALYEPQQVDESVKQAPHNCACGVSKYKQEITQSPYILGGTPAKIEEFPWFAAITRYQHNKQPRWKVICGAALINQQFAITAAHCLHNRYKDTLEVVFNIKDAHSIDNDTATVRRKIKRFLIHPKYNPNTQHDDIALVQFTVPIDLRSQKPQPICLPKDAKNSYAANTATIAGFGHTGYGSSSDKPKENSRVLMKVSVPVLSHAECLKSKVPTKKNITENMICAGSHGKDACINDSGGALMVRENGRFVVAGLASWGVGCGLEGYPGVYTRVTKYLTWIKSSSESSCS